MRFAYLCLIGLISLITRYSYAAELKDFAGDWAGSGVTETAGDSSPALAERELDVKIGLAREGQGFLVLTFWQDAGVPNTPQTPLKTRGFDFKPSRNKPGQWVAQDTCDAANGQVCAFARLAGNSLIITSFEMAANGQTETQVFVRTLTMTGMSYSYTRSIEGWPVRRVGGVLTKKKI